MKPAVGGPRRGPGVELQADVAGRARAASAPDQVDRRGEVDVDVVPLGRLGRGGEDRLGQPVGQLQAGRHGAPVHRAGLLVLLVGLAGQVAAHDALELEHLGPSHQHGPAGPLGREAEPRQRGPISPGSAASSVPGTTSAISSHQNAVMAVSTRPLSAMGSAMMTSKALTRSEATMSRRSSPAS